MYSAIVRSKTSFTGSKVNPKHYVILRKSTILSTDNLFWRLGEKKVSEEQASKTKDPTESLLTQHKDGFFMYIV
jgi:hypothetical protein